MKDLSICSMSCVLTGESPFFIALDFSEIISTFARLMGKLSKLRITHHDISLLFHLCKAVGSKTIWGGGGGGWGLKNKSELFSHFSIVLLCVLHIRMEIIGEGGSPQPPCFRLPCYG